MSRQPNWRFLAEGFLANERKTKPFHHPPSTGIVLEWRKERRIGCIQWPVLADFPAVVFVSIMSVYIDPEYIRAIRNLDPGRLLLTAEDRLDLRGNFHILRREGDRLTFMTAEEMMAAEASPMAVHEIAPTVNGFAVRPILHRETLWKQKPEDN